MRGGDEIQSSMFSYISPEMRVPADHPLRAVRTMVDAALKQMSGEFDKVYSRRGRPSIAPERLYRALLLQVACSIRTERLAHAHKRISMSLLEVRILIPIDLHVAQGTRSTPDLLASFRTASVLPVVFFSPAESNRGCHPAM